MCCVAGICDVLTLDVLRNSIPPTTTMKAWETKMRSAEGQCWADVGFWGGVVPGECTVCASALV